MIRCRHCGRPFTSLGPRARYCPRCVVVYDKPVIMPAPTRPWARWVDPLAGAGALLVCAAVLSLLVMLLG